MSREVAVASGPGGFEFTGARLAHIETADAIEVKSPVEIDGSKYRVTKVARRGGRASITLESVTR